MADRTTKVRLIAEVSGYVAGMEKAAKATREMADGSAAKLAATRQALDGVSTSMLAIGAVAAAAVAITVKKFADFDQAMSNVKAATQETTGNMELLRAAAIDAGGATVFSAVEAANAIEELGKAGLTTQEILSGGLSGALSLAAAGQLDVARAAEVTAITIKQFNLQGRDAAHVADLLAAGAGKAAGDVDDLAQALNQSALVADQTGLSIEETTGTLAAFASAGLLGSDAGTSFKTMLQRLTPQSEEAAARMAELGITAYDSAGQFIGITKFAGLLQKQLETLTPEARNAALGVMFGADAIRAAGILYTQGAEGIQAWIDKTNDSGYAAQVAADRMNNLKGDIEKLGGAFDSLVINSGSATNDMLRGLVQSITFLVDGLAELPPSVLNTTTIIGGMTAALLLTGGATIKAVTAFADFKQSADFLGISLGSVATKAGLVAGAIAYAAVIVGTFISRQAEAKGRTDAFRDSLDQATGAMTDYTTKLVAKRLEDSGAAKAAEAHGISLGDLTDAAMGGKQAISDLVNQIDPYATALVEGGRRGQELVSVQSLLNDVLSESSGELAKARESQERLATATTSGADSAEAMAAELEQLAEEARVTEESINAAKDAILHFGDVVFNAHDAEIAFQEAIRQANEALAENGATLDLSTEAGARNQQALDDLAQTASEAAIAAYELSGNEQQLAVDLDAARTTLYDQAIQFGMTEGAARKYVDQVLMTPEEVKTQIKLLGAEAAISKLQQINRLLSSMGELRITIPGVSATTLTARESGGIEEYAQGGIREGVYRGRPGGVIKFAEPTTGWEAFVSGKPGAEPRNRGILMEAANRLGMLPALMPAQAAVSGDRPIYMDGSLFGVLRTVASGEAQIVLNTAVESYARDVRAGGLAA